MQSHLFYEVSKRKVKNWQPLPTLSAPMHMRRFNHVATRWRII